MYTQKQKIDNQARALNFINRFGWMRGDTLGTAMWPKSASAERMGQRLAQALLKQALLIARVLPNRAGAAYVLSSSGARFLQDLGIHALSGKNWGSVKSGKWTPPASWTHDFWTQCLIAWLLSSKALEMFMTEKEIREKIDGQSFRYPKIPDALLKIADKVYWLEVERTRKSGKHQHKMIEVAIQVMRGHGDAICGMKPARMMFGVPSDITDVGTGHKINHQLRLVAAFKRIVDRDVMPTFVSFEVRGVAPTNLKITKTLIESDFVTRRLARLETQMREIKPDVEGGFSVWYLNKVENFFSTGRGLAAKHLDAKIRETINGFLVEAWVVQDQSKFDTDQLASEGSLFAAKECASFAKAKRFLAGALDRWDTAQLT